MLAMLKTYKFCAKIRGKIIPMLIHLRRACSLRCYISLIRNTRLDFLAVWKIKRDNVQGNIPLRQVTNMIVTVVITLCVISQRYCLGTKDDAK